MPFDEKTCGAYSYDCSFQGWPSLRARRQTFTRRPASIQDFAKPIDPREPIPRNSKAREIPARGSSVRSGAAEIA